MSPFTCHLSSTSTAADLPPAKSLTMQSMLVYKDQHLCFWNNHIYQNKYIFIYPNNLKQFPKKYTVFPGHAVPGPCQWHRKHTDRRISRLLDCIGPGANLVKIIYLIQNAERPISFSTAFIQYQHSGHSTTQVRQQWTNLIWQECWGRKISNTWLQQFQTNLKTDHTHAK